MNRPVENPAELTSQDGVQYTGPKKHFQAYPDENHSESPLNDTHAEYKLFNALVDILEAANLRKELTGTLYLYTEREMCSACEKTFQAFQGYFDKEYQAIKSYVSWIRPYRRSHS